MDITQGPPITSSYDSYILMVPTHVSSQSSNPGTASGFQESGQEKKMGNTLLGRGGKRVLLGIAAGLLKGGEHHDSDN